MTGRDDSGRFTPGNGYASIGGRRRAEVLPAARRATIARAGWQAVVARRFGGDAAAAKAWFGAVGAWASDAPYRETFPKFAHPGPMPPREGMRV